MCWDLGECVGFGTLVSVCWDLGECVGFGTLVSVCWDLGECVWGISVRLFFSTFLIKLEV